MRSCSLYCIVAAIAVIVLGAPVAHGQDPDTPLAKTAPQLGRPPVALWPGERVRLATVTGRIVCDAYVERADSTTLIVEARRRDRETFTWHEVQYLWRGVARQKPAGWNALQATGAILGVVGTAVVLQKAKQSESFAPLGWVLGMLPMVLASSISLFAVGESLHDSQLAEFTEWQRLPLSRPPSASGILPQHVPAVCGD
ncbi:MAG: hypothetical protein SFW08_12325 [Gemmatimonadaceae bacterium]|nr:hypothetical protein [Gemmatimonadaceae bacterium]